MRRQPDATGQHLTRSDLWLHPRHFRGRHHAAAIFVVALLAVVGFRLFPSQDVTILTNGQSYRVSTSLAPAHEALRAAQVALEPGDSVSYGSGGRFASVSVERARQVTVDIDGRSVSVRSRANTIAGALADAGLELRPGDRVFLDGRLASPRGSLYSPAFAARSAPALVSALQPVDIRVQRAVSVAVYLDTFRLDVSSAAPSVADLLGELGITIREGDLVHPTLDAPIVAGTAIRLAKGRTVNVRVDGADQALYTRAMTVADIVRALGLQLGPEDTVTPALDELVTPATAVTIATTRVVTQTVDEVVPPPMTTEFDAEAASGSVRIKEGAPGKRLVQYSVTLKNGVEVDRKVLKIDEVQAAAPTRQIVGTKPPKSSKPAASAPPAASGGTVDSAVYSGEYKRKVHVLATWYNASHGAWERDSPHYGKTYLEIQVTQGICAVDPAVIPLRSRFYVPGYGMCYAADIGGGVKGFHVDLGYPESAGDPGWGVQYLDIYIID
ncbi:MAG: ubiquitin-like domain-containing protein [Dehalococcoidia bacterium]